MKEKNNWKYSSQEYGELKKKELQETYVKIDEATEKILSNDEIFKDFLDLQADMERYSVPNLLLIFSQNPKVTQIKDFDGWSKDEITIKKGEKGISILQPYTYQKNGEKKTSYRLKKVFDVSQTVADSPLLPEKEVPLKSKVLETLIDKSPVDIDGTDREDILYGKDAVFVPEEKKIYMRKGMEPVDFMLKLMEQIAEVRLCSGGNGEMKHEEKFGAECVTYMLCRAAELEIGQREPHMPPHYQSLEPKAARKELSRANLVYRQMKNEIFYPEKKRDRDLESR